MSLISLFIQNQYWQLLISSIVLLIMFYAIGRVIQKNLRFAKSNTFISIPIGLLTYTLINQIVYAPIIITNLGITILGIFDTLKAITVVLFIIMSYESWLPKFSLNDLKKILLSVSSILFVSLIYLLFSFIFDSFSPINEEWINGINNIKDGVYKPITDEDSFSSVMSGYQSTYYWIYLNSEFSSASTELVVNLEMAIIWLVPVSLAIQSSFVNTEKTITSFMLATLLSTLSIIGLGFLSPTNDMFYTISICIIITTLFYDYSRRVMPSNNWITISLLATISLITIGSYAFAYVLIFGFLSITLSSIRGGDIIKNSIHYLLIIVSLILYYIIAIFIHDISYIQTIFIYVGFLMILLLMVFFPLYSIAYTQSRREELVKLEKTIKNQIGIGILFTSIGFVIIALLVNFTNHFNTIDILVTFFEKFNFINNKFWLGFSLYLVLILLPIILIYILWYFNKRSTLLGLFAFMNILLNPILISTSCEFLNIQFEPFTILVPSLLIIIIWILGEITKRISSLH